ncbi:hypothetical protein [Olsenella massiliensis]|uniref:hypothetical protein n=1 Tax=Olsenella massiliensis TaxID=1622075 RepID=UPI0009EA20AF|nr:hypothetical protein [Olsenella massiliensis]
MTRRGLLRASLLLAGGALAQGCSGRRGEVPDVTIGGPEDALAWALGELGGRYGEEFEQEPGTGVTPYEPDSRHLEYELCARPAADPKKPFGCTVATHADTRRLSYPLMDDYTQYRFKPQLEEPFLEAARGTDGLAGYSARLSEPYMGERDWRPSELEAYLHNGYTRPGLAVTLMLPRDGSASSWAGAVRSFLGAVWGLGRRMDVYAGMEGFVPYEWGNLFTLDVSQTVPSGRGPKPPSLDYIEQEVRDSQIDLGSDRLERWDGAGDPGDPGYTRLPQITWLPGHPVMD